MKNSKPKKGSIYDRWRIDSEEEPLEPMNGVLTSYYENGQKEIEKTYKDGKLEGLWTQWYENGQKMGVGTFKDGKPDGLWTEWYQNGKKKTNITWKGWKMISEKNWNKDGSVKE